MPPPPPLKKTEKNELGNGITKYMCNMLIALLSSIIAQSFPAEDELNATNMLRVAHEYKENLVKNKHGTNVQFKGQ